MAPEEMQDLVQDFTAKATAVNAVVQELPNMAAALQYVVDVCENKAPCELMADEDVEKCMKLLTFLPLGYCALHAAGKEDKMAYTFTLQTVAANLGGMLTPFGNPQNLYLFNHYTIPNGEFLTIMLPPFLLSTALILACCLLIPRETLTVPAQETPVDKRRCIVYGVLFCTAAAMVLRGIPYWLGLAAICGAAWLFQMLPTVLAQSLDGQQMLRLYFNWINGRNDGTLKDSYLWFYIKNIGLVYLLLIPAFVHAKPKQRWLYGGGLAILALAELVVFQPNNYDNNKLLFITHALGCMLAAQLLADWAKRLRTPALRAAVIAVCCFVGMFGSVLTLGREALSDYQQWSADDITLAAYIDENAESDALFLTSDSHLTPVFALAGRQILCGSGSYVYYHGMDYADEYNAMRTLYETPDTVTLQIWGVQYAVFDSSVYSRFSDANEEWYAQRYPLWYENGGCRVYKIH